MARQWRSRGRRSHRKGPGLPRSLWLCGRCSRWSRVGTAAQSRGWIWVLTKSRDAAEVTSTPPREARVGDTGGCAPQLFLNPQNRRAQAQPRAACYKLLPGFRLLGTKAGVAMVRRVVVVLGEEIFAPVAVEVAPDAVDVVGVVLGVVELDEKRFSLDPVIMADAALEPAHPGESNRVQPRAANLVEPLLSLSARLRVEVFLDQRQQRSLLVVVQRGVGDAGIGLDCGFALVAGDDVGRGGPGQDRHGTLRGGERLQQRVAQVLFGAQWACPLHGSLAHLGGVGPKELWAAGDRLAVHDGPVLRTVMSLVTPTPGSTFHGFTEEGEEVELGITRWSSSLFDLAQHVFELADGFGLAVSLLAQARAQDVQSGCPLRGSQSLQRNALSSGRRVKPMEAFLGIERQNCLRSLARVERGQKSLGGGDHGGSGLLLRSRPIGGGDEPQRDQSGNPDNGSHGAG